MNTVNWLNHLLQSRAGARRSLTRSQQRCLKSAQQEVTLKDQTGNLFVVSHMGEERQVLSSYLSVGMLLESRARVWHSLLAVFVTEPRCQTDCCCCCRFVSIADLCLQGFGNSPALGMQASPDFRLQDSLSAANRGSALWEVALARWWCVTAVPCSQSPLTVWGCWGVLDFNWGHLSLCQGPGLPRIQDCLLRLAQGTGTTEPFNSRHQDGGM